MKHWLALILLIAVPLFVSGCGTVATDRPSFNMARLPEYVHNAPHNTQIAYQYALEHSEMLTHQPCYCGCAAIDHKNLLECYIREIDSMGRVTFDIHASACRVCVDITLDVIRLSDEGKSQLEIRQYIDATYSQVGPSTDTSMPEA